MLAWEACVHCVLLINATHITIDSTSIEMNTTRASKTVQQISAQLFDSWNVRKETSMLPRQSRNFWKAWWKFPAEYHHRGWNTSFALRTGIKAWVKGMEVSHWRLFKETAHWNISQESLGALEKVCCNWWLVAYKEKWNLQKHIFSCSNKNFLRLWSLC